MGRRLIISFGARQMIIKNVGCRPGPAKKYSWQAKGALDVGLKTANAHSGKTLNV